MMALVFTQRRLPILAVAVIIAAIATSRNASAEPADGWAPTGPESKVFVAPRDDGRTVGVYARPAKKGVSTGILVRLTLTGFTDKKLALKEEDLPELFWTGLFRLYAGRRQNPTVVTSKSLDLIGDLESYICDNIDDLLDTNSAKSALKIRADAVGAAVKAGGDLTQRFINANSQTVQSVAAGSRGKVVRAIHAVLISELN